MSHYHREPHKSIATQYLPHRYWNSVKRISRSFSPKNASIRTQSEQIKKEEAKGWCWGETMCWQGLRGNGNFLGLAHSHLVHTMKQHGRSHKVVCTLHSPQTLLTWYVHSHLSGKSLLLLINKPPLATLTGVTSAAMQINTSCKARTQLLKGQDGFWQNGGALPRRPCCVTLPCIPTHITVSRREPGTSLRRGKNNVTALLQISLAPCTLLRKQTETLKLWGMYCLCMFSANPPPSQMWLSCQNKLG